MFCWRSPQGAFPLVGSGLYSSTHRLRGFLLQVRRWRCESQHQRPRCCQAQCVGSLCWATTHWRSSTGMNTARSCLCSEMCSCIHLALDLAPRSQVLVSKAALTNVTVSSSTYRKYALEERQLEVVNRSAWSLHGFRDHHHSQLRQQPWISCVELLSLQKNRPIFLVADFSHYIARATLFGPDWTVARSAAEYSWTCWQHHFRNIRFSRIVYALTRSVPCFGWVRPSLRRWLTLGSFFNTRNGFRRRVVQPSL